MSNSDKWLKAVRDGVEKVREHKRSQETIVDWFFVQEIKMNERLKLERQGKDVDAPKSQAEILCAVAEKMPLTIPDGAVIAGSQDGAFSPSYSLINPAFKVEEFAGYCDPTAIYDDISPSSEISLTKQRIEKVRSYWETTPYVKNLKELYNRYNTFTKEVVFFFEPVTGHHIPDMRDYLQYGALHMQKKAAKSGSDYGEAMALAIEAVIILAGRYRKLALQKCDTVCDEDEKLRLHKMAETLNVVPANEAANLQQAIQMYALLWQVMVLEQSPNPYAISAGNIDRVLLPYYRKQEQSRELAVELLRHLLCFFQVGRRCWAISQNVLAGGKDVKGQDLSSDMTYIVLDAFFDTNDPQPALSVKLHKNTPDELYKSLGRFFFNAGHSTPSIFNDDMMFKLLGKGGIDAEDLPDYSIAGCQEPLIMGKSSLNTTNTWLNIAKILELALNDGKSLISSRQILPQWKHFGYLSEQDAYNNIEELLLKMLDYCLPEMSCAGNGCTVLMGKHNPVPFTSSLMGGLEHFKDMRDISSQGTKYNGSGCLIHGLSVVADSIYAVKQFLTVGNWNSRQLRQALNDNFNGHNDVLAFLIEQPKFGNDCPDVDEIAARICDTVSTKVSALVNNLGNPYLADWSTPSTHLLYGYWVGATADGRKARTMLGYGVDPTCPKSCKGLIERILSGWKLPYDKLTGGYASHIGINPSEAKSIPTFEEKGIWLKDEVVNPLFGFGNSSPISPYYVYFNIDNPLHLRQVLQNPKKYAPNGIYIMRIHGTFVNFLDLSPAIQEDIITRIESGAA